MKPFQTEFAHTVFKGKYPFHPEEDWSGCSKRVVSNVLTGLHEAPRGHRLLTLGDIHDRLFGLINERLFIPGGRYLYGAGRDFHQVNNCLLMRASDNREGWATLKYQSMMALMTGAGIGVYYGDIRESNSLVGRTGGKASGPVPLMRSVNEDGRAAVQGGDRRSAIWAGLPWWHPDIFDFIRCKDWPKWLREQKEKDWTISAPMDMTNISVCLDDEFFEAIHDEQHPKSEHAWSVYWKTVDKMVTTGEPGFSVDLGEKANEVTRNAPVVGETRVLTDQGYQQVYDLVGNETNVWTGFRWAPNVVFKQTKSQTRVVKVKFSGGREIRCDPEHPFLVERYVGAGSRRKLDGIVRIVAEKLVKDDILHVSLPEISAEAVNDDDYELGYLYGDGSFGNGRAEVTFCSEASKELAASFSGHSFMNPHDSRGYIRAYYSKSDRFEDCTKDKFPQDVENHASFIAGLFDADGNYEPTQNRIRLASKHLGFLRDVARSLEALGILANISKAGTSTYGRAQGWQLVVMRDYNDLFADLVPTRRLKIPYSAKGYRKSVLRVESVEDDGFEDVFCADVKVPEHSFQAEGVIISNCTEITSADDSDVCNLGSLVLSRYPNPEQFGAAVRDAVLFLTAGSLYSDVPYDKVAEIREKNRRLGLGLIGVHEFCLMHGVKYGSDESFEVLAPYMREYDRALEYACDWQDRLAISNSIGATAIAPNGTIGILAESTPSGDPLFSSARKRVVITSSPSGDIHTTHVVVDPVAKRLVEQGVDPNSIEDAYSLAFEPERRLAMQAYLQDHVDHAVSSTINLPYPIHDPEERLIFGQNLLKFLPRLRGVTAYPDGARAGQPLTPVPLKWALEHEGETSLESVEDTCSGAVCGI